MSALYLACQLATYLFLLAAVLGGVAKSGAVDHLDRTLGLWSLAMFAWSAVELARELA